MLSDIKMPPIGGTGDILFRFTKLYDFFVHAYKGDDVHGHFAISAVLAKLFI